MRFKSVLFLIFIVGVIVTTAFAQNEGPIAAIGRSNIDANVSDKKDFDTILNRDLTKYVTDAGDKDIRVVVELLRNGPSQSGVALPKFYIWIEKRNSKGEIMDEAATRIAAVEKAHFDVIQYYDRKCILAEPELISKVFPTDVYEKILNKLKAHEK